MFMSVERVIITELRSSTYFAELHLRHGEERTVVSSRPSDAVAVAVRTETSLFVQDEVESEGIILAIENEEDEDDGSLNKLAEQFREFLDTVRPEDFSG